MNAQAMPLSAVRSHFQLRYARGDWKELDLPVNSLKDIIQEVRGLPHNRKQIKALYELDHMVVEYHCGYTYDQTLKNQAENPKSDVYDVVKKDYELVSNLDDVLKIKVSFTIRYKDRTTWKAGGLRSKWPPRQVEEILTIMPGN